MKKMICLLFVSTFLFSCGAQEENSENFETLSGQVLEENQ